MARSVAIDQAAVKVQVLFASGRSKTRARLLPGAEWAPAKKLSYVDPRMWR